MLSIGRALVARPRALLLDEPSLGLAPLMVAHIMRLIRSLARSGQFALALDYARRSVATEPLREEAQRDRELLAAIHSAMIAWDDHGFLAALPSLRLAFMYFTPREKVHMARSLFAEQSTDAPESEPVPLAVNTAEAAEAMAFENMLFELAERYGVRLDSPAPQSDPHP